MWKVFLIIMLCSNSHVHFVCKIWIKVIGAIKSSSKTSVKFSIYSKKYHVFIIFHQITKITKITKLFRSLWPYHAVKTLASNFTRQRAPSKGSGIIQVGKDFFAKLNPPSPFENLSKNTLPNDGNGTKFRKKLNFHGFWQSFSTDPLPLFEKR